MFDFGIGYTEIMVVAMVALIVIGPKDLPKVLRHIGQMTAAMRRMAGEFQRHLDDAMKETGVDEVRREVTAMTSGLKADLTGGNLDDTLRKTENDIRNAMSGAPAVPSTPVAPAPAPQLTEAAGSAAALPPAPAMAATGEAAPEPAVQPLPVKDAAGDAAASGRERP